MQRGRVAVLGFGLAAALAAPVGLAGGVAASDDDDKGGLLAVVNARFEAAAPAVGDVMPDLELYDAEGEPVDTTALFDGKHTVLVLGCLT